MRHHRISPFPSHLPSWAGCAWGKVTLLKTCQVKHLLCRDPKPTLAWLVLYLLLRSVEFSFVFSKILKFNSAPKPAHPNLSAETPPSSKAGRTSVVTAPGGIVLHPMPPTLRSKPLTIPSIYPDLAPGKEAGEPAYPWLYIPSGD